MRYRDSPTVQESVVIAADPQRVWELVTDVTMPAKFSAELTAVEWIHGDTVAVGNRFRGHNSNPARGQWTTESLVVEVEEGRRWVWDVQGDGVGLAERIYERGPELITRAYELIASCPCPGGCPSCVGPSELDGGRKVVALSLCRSFGLSLGPSPEARSASAQRHAVSA